MELFDLKYIVAVAEEGSLSKASERLYITQPTLSQAIRKVECQIGISLFDRTSRGMRLTREGMRFVGQARQVLQIKEQLSLEMQKFTTTEQNTLNIGVPTTWGGFIISKIFRQFHDVYPMVNLNISEMKSSRIETVLLRKQIDIAIIAVPELDLTVTERMENTLILSDPILIAIPTDSTVCKKLRYEETQEFPLISPEDLKKQPYIDYKSDVPLHAIAEYFFAEYDIQPQIVASVTSAGTAKRLAQCGMGWTLISRTFARYCLAPPYPIYCIPDLARFPRLYIMAVWRKDEHLCTELLYLLELLRHIEFM